jgi:hypothetical protein
VLDAILDIERAPDWNPQLMQGKVVEKLDDHTAILHKQFKAKQCMIELHIDVVYWERVKELENDGGFLVLALSELATYHSAKISCDECVRGFIHVSGWILTPWATKGNPNGHTTVTYVGQVDLKELPQKISELACKVQPFCVNRLQDAMEKGFRGKPQFAAGRKE